MPEEHNTTIHTRINDKFRISSIYRNWGIMLNPEATGWETIIWEKIVPESGVVLELKEKIFWQGESYGHAQNVVNHHRAIKRDWARVEPDIRSGKPERDIGHWAWDLDDVNLDGWTKVLGETS